MREFRNHGFNSVFLSVVKIKIHAEKVACEGKSASKNISRENKEHIPFVYPHELRNKSLEMENDFLLIILARLVKVERDGMH